jgi:hypothetical protein
MDKEINVEELIKATNDAIPICCIGEMRPVYFQGSDGQMYSCAMSTITSEQGFCNGIPYRGTSYNYGSCGCVMNPDFIRGCCVRIACVDPNSIIIRPPELLQE